MKSKVIIVSPMLREFHCAREAFGAKELTGRPCRTAVASLNHMDVQIISSGSALSAAIRAIDSCFGVPDLLIDSGTAGGVSEKVAVGDIILGEIFRYEGYADIESKAPSLSSPEGIFSGTVMTVDRAIGTGAERMELAESSDICTMETYHLASAAKRWNCPFLSIRGVTDLADENTAVSFKKNSRPVCLRLYRILKQMLMNISH